VRKQLYVHIKTIIVLTGGKLTFFKLCNYDKRYGVIFRIVSNYFLVYETYFVVGEF
jgi:hypothetical protein